MPNGRVQRSALDIGPAALRAATPKLPSDKSSVSGLARRSWIINGDFLALKSTGVARYAREVTMALDGLIVDRDLLTRNVDLEIVAPCPGIEPLQLGRIPVAVLPEWRPRLPQIWNQLQLPRHVPGGLISFCNLAPLQVRHQIVCMHDLQTYTTPESYSLPFRLAHRILLPLLGHRVSRVTTVSEQSRSQLAAFGVAPPSRTVVTYNGADHALRWSADRGSRAWPMRRPFVVAICRQEPHKNMRLVRRLIPRLDALNMDVALIGGSGAELFAHDGEPPSNLHLLGRLTDDGMAAVFARALCLIFPSRTEGFGLPAVEAMTCGCPVIASTAPSLREVCGAAAVYADPDDMDGWISAITGLAADEANRNRLIAAGRRQAAGYSWTVIARTYLRLMAEIDGVLPTAGEDLR